MMTQSSLDISLLFERINRARNELSTGKRVTTPSDDPVAFSEASSLRQVLNTNDIIKQNVSEVRSFLEVTEGSLKGAVDILQRGQQLAVRGLTDVLKPEDRQLIVSELDKLLEQMLGLGNTNFKDSYIFGGQRTTIKPFDVQGNPIQSVSYQGDGNLISRDIGTSRLLAMNFPGDQVFMGGADPTKSAFLALLNLRNEFRDSNMVSLTAINNTNQTITAAEAGATLLTALNAGNELATPVNNGGAGPGTFVINNTTITYDIAADTINDVLTRINAGVSGVTAAYDDVTQRVVLTSTNGRLIDIKDTKGNFAASMHLLSPTTHFTSAIGNLTEVLGKIGSSVRQLDLADTQVSTKTITFTTSLSRVEDTDTSKRILELSLSSTAFQAALSVTAKTIPPTLLDFLR